MLAAKVKSLRNFTGHFKLKKNFRAPVSAVVSRIRGNGMFDKKLKLRHTAFWTNHNPEDVKRTFNYFTDPLENWKDRHLWQRKLSNKLNAREFAKLYGCRVPKLYWKGRDINTINFDLLPAHYVIKPSIGHSCRLIFLFDNSLNLMDGKTYTNEDILKLLAKPLQENMELEFIIEEFIKTENNEYKIPVDYKFYMFNGEIATIELINRFSPTQGVATYYDENWNVMKSIASLKKTKYQPGSYQPPPRCLKEMVSCVKELSKSYEIFVRIDFYASSEGAVFGEFTPTPGCSKYLTLESDKNFINYWNRFCAGMI